MPASLSPGMRLGDYRIVEALGSGGMGEVYLARDARLDRDVAIKVIAHSVADDPDRLRRFIREARTASALNHPNIAHVYEIGEVDGRHFLVMEYIRGEGLERRVASRGLPLADVIIYATQVADALDEAHGQGIIHRDLKPANVMVTTRNRVKVLDFGLAKVLPAATSDASGYSTALAGTSAGLVLGTLDYMSPEQVRGFEVDRRTDIFSFGVLLYQMITGRLPFASTSRTDTIYRITQMQPEAVSRYAYDVPPELERIVRKCLEKDPARRYQSAHDLLVDLKHLRPDGSGIGIPVASPAQPGSSRWRWVAALGSVAVAAAIGAGAAAWWATTGTGGIESLAVVPRVAAGNVEGGVLAETLAKALTNALTQLPNVSIAPRHLSFAAGASMDDPFAIARSLGVQAVLLIKVEPRPDAAEIDLQLIDAERSREVWGKEYTRSLGELELARESISDEVWNALRLRLNAEDRRAVEVLQLYERARYLAARRKEPDLRAAIDLYDQALQRDRNHALALAGKAEALNLLAVYSFDRPNEAFPKAKAAAERALAIDDGLAEAHTTLAWVHYRWEWDFASARREFERAVSLAPEYAQARHWFAMFETAMGRFEAGLTQLRQAQALDPMSVPYRADIGWTLVMARRDRDAVAAAVEASRFAPNSFLPFRVLGMAHTGMGAFDSAIEAYRQLITLEGSNSVLFNAELAHVYARAGRLEEAKRVLTELLARRARNTYVSPYLLAIVYAAAGDREQAIDWLEAAYRERDNQLPWIKVDPRLDHVREDPRFGELLAKMKFE